MNLSAFSVISGITVKKKKKFCLWSLLTTFLNLVPKFLNRANYYTFQQWGNKVSFVYLYCFRKWSQFKIIAEEWLATQARSLYPSAWHCLCVVVHMLLSYGVCDAFVLASRLLLCYCSAGRGGGKWSPPSVLHTQTIVLCTHSCHDLRSCGYTLLGIIYQFVLLQVLK